MAKQSNGADRDIVLTRLYDAPRELVFKAWSSPEHLAHWHAPRGCSIVFRSFEFREGRGFHSCIKDPSGNPCWCKGTYRRIVEPEVIEYTLEVSDARGRSLEPAEVGMHPDWPRVTIVTVSFVARGNRTELTLHHTAPEPLAKQTGAHPSWIQMLDRLGERLSAKVLHNGAGWGEGP